MNKTISLIISCAMLGMTVMPIHAEETETPVQTEETVLTEEQEVPAESEPEEIPEEEEPAVQENTETEEPAEETSAEETEVPAEETVQEETAPAEEIPAGETPAVQDTDENPEEELPAEEESVPVFRTAIVKTLPSDRSVEGFIARLYNVCLDRDYDQGGMDNWTRQLKSGTKTAAGVAASFFYSEEMTQKNLDNAAFTETAYRVFLDREPDESGFNTWFSALEAGATKDYILYGFSGSQEFKNLCREYGVKPGQVALTNIRDQNIKATKFVARLYEKCLGRKYDVSGLENWLKQLLNGHMTGADIAGGFMTSRELAEKNLSDEEYVRLGYAALFDREADESGLRHWMYALENGCSWDYALTGMIGSQEFIAMCRSYGIQPGSRTLTDVRDRYPVISRFVARLYEKCLGRKYDISGLRTWVNQLASGNMNGGEAVKSFFSSAELAARNLNNEDFVTAAYQTILDRDPDESGFAEWTKKLNSGTSRSDIINGFVRSQEFRKLCRSYGIMAGNDLKTMISSLNSASSSASVQGFGGYTPGGAIQSRLQAAADSITAGGYSIGFILLDLNTGRGVSYNPDVRLYSASSIKGFYVAALTCMNPASINESQDLMLQTVVNSSDSAYLTLYDRYGEAPYEQWKKDADVTDPGNYFKFTYYTPRDMAKLWARNYDFFTSSATGKTVGTWYQNPSRSLIHSTLGNRYTTRSKAGYIWYGGYNAANDAGIVYADSGTYIAAVMTNMPGSLERLTGVMEAMEAAHNEMVK